MPEDRKKPCKKPWCPNLTHNRFCEAHEKQEARRYDQERKKEPWWKWLHSRRWRKASKAHKDEFPICAECERIFSGTPLEGIAERGARVTHHIIPHKGNYELFWDPENWESRCRPCHELEHKHERFKKRG